MGPLFSVYIHAVSATLFGQTVVVTRLTQVFVSLLAPLATSMILKQAFVARFWWVGALLLAVAPAWFLHSRTGFDGDDVIVLHVLPVVLFALSPALSSLSLCGDHIRALTFFTYSSGQMLMVSVGAVLAVSDIRYHFRHWRTALPGLGLIALLALPVFSVWATNPEFVTVTLRTMDSYWFHDLTLAQKIEQFMRSWAQGDQSNLLVYSKPDAVGAPPNGRLRQSERVAVAVLPGWRRLVSLELKSPSTARTFLDGAGDADGRGAGDRRRDRTACWPSPSLPAF